VREHLKEMAATIVRGPEEGTGAGLLLRAVEILIGIRWRCALSRCWPAGRRNIV